MPELWDWADVAALGVMARHDFESVGYCKPGWECQGGTVPYVLAHLDWRAAEHKQIAAGIRYGAEEEERRLRTFAVGDQLEVGTDWIWPKGGERPVLGKQIL